MIRCAWCEAPFEPQRGKGGGGRAQYCSDRCRYQMRKSKGLGAFKPDAFSETDVSPDEWDGVTQFSPVPARTRDYYLSCVLCAQQVPYTLTDAEAYAMRPQRCACGSRMLLELDAGRGTVPSMRPTIRKPNPVLAQSRI